MATVVNASAGAKTTFIIITGTAQQVVNALASRRQNKQVFIIHGFTENGQNLSVLVEER